DLAAEGVGEEAALLERAEDAGPAVVEGGELLQAVADGGDLDLVELAGDLLAVAGDEGDGGAFLEQLGGGGDLGDLHGAAELLGDAENVLGVELDLGGGGGVGGGGGRGGGGGGRGGGEVGHERFRMRIRFV